MTTSVPAIVREMGRLLKDERELRQLSREEAAARADISAGHLRDIEEG